MIIGGNEMNNDLTNVYAIIKREFKEELEYLRLQKSRVLAAFLHYNAHNEMFAGTAMGSLTIKSYFNCLQCWIN